MAETLTPEVVDLLVQRHRRCLQFLESRVGNRDVAEELLQAAFVKAMERGSQLREGESAVAWFYRLLRNALVDFYRRQDAGGPRTGRRGAKAGYYLGERGCSLASSTEHGCLDCTCKTP